MGQYSTNAFTTELTSSSQINMGEELFVEAEWSVTSLDGKLEFFIESCSIRDVPSDGSDTGSTIDIIHDSCYASGLGGNIAQFSYRSFSFDVSTPDTQELECVIGFCVVGETCTGLVTADEDCPTNSAF